MDGEEKPPLDTLRFGATIFGSHRRHQQSPRERAQVGRSRRRCSLGVASCGNATERVGEGSSWQ